MGSVQSLHAFINRVTGGNNGNPESTFYHKESRVGGAAAAAPVAGRYTSLWEYEGITPHGVPPTTVAAPDHTTNGGIKQTAPGGGRQRWLHALSAGMTAAGTILVYDRLLHIGNLDGTNTGAQAVAGAITRNTGGKGNEIWVEIYAQIGATPTTITASYTDEAGNSGQTTAAVAIGGTGLREAQRMIPLSRAVGDSGVQAVASVTLAGTTGTAGNFGVVVLRPIATIGVSTPGVLTWHTFLDGWNPFDISAACVAMTYLPNSTTVVQVDGFFNSAEF